jgi:hypothetical protein
MPQQTAGTGKYLWNRAKHNINHVFISWQNRDSSVGITISYMLDNLGSTAGGGA